jgi:hypothetical protein
LFIWFLCSWSTLAYWRFFYLGALMFEKMFGAWHKMQWEWRRRQMVEQIKKECREKQKTEKTAKNAAANKRK